MMADENTVTDEVVVDAAAASDVEPFFALTSLSIVEADASVEPFESSMICA